jgi:hypothetical protein
MATLYPIPGEARTVLPASGPAFTQEELQRTLAGRVEFLPGKPGHVFALNQEGQRGQLPFNMQATAVAHQSGMYPDTAFYGTVLELSFEEAGVSIDLGQARINSDREVGGDV